MFCCFYKLIPVQACVTSDLSSLPLYCPQPLLIRILFRRNGLVLCFDKAFIQHSQDRFVYLILSKCSNSSQQSKVHRREDDFRKMENQTGDDECEAFTVGCSVSHQEKA